MKLILSKMGYISYLKRKELFTEILFKDWKALSSFRLDMTPKEVQSIVIKSSQLVNKLN